MDIIYNDNIKDYLIYIEDRYLFVVNDVKDEIYEVEDYKVDIDKLY